MRANPSQTPGRADSFGVIVAGCDHDLHLALGAIESVRHFMPDVPIALVFDGNSNLDRIVEAYSLEVVRRENTQDSFLRKDSFGYGVTKMVAFWESPFEEFLYMDSDACAWGDLASKVRLGGLDMRVPLMGYEYDEESIGKWFFDLGYVRSIDPEFDPMESRARYFCTGTYVARRGLFDVERYRRLLEARSENPSRFLLGEMGLLNYMIFSSVQRGELTVESSMFQYVNSDSTWAETRRHFRFEGGLPFVGGAGPIVLHYAGVKPYVFSDVHSEPMRFFRVNSKMRLFPGRGRSWAVRSVVEEDFLFFSRGGLATRLAAASRCLAAKVARRMAGRGGWPSGDPA